MGHNYQKGIGVEIDIDKSREYFQVASERGNNASLNNLANLHLNEKNSRDVDEAIRLYQLSNEKGDKYALFNLGRIYEKGIFIYFYLFYYFLFYFMIFFLIYSIFLFYF